MTYIFQAPIIRNLYEHGKCLSKVLVEFVSMLLFKKADGVLVLILFSYWFGGVM